MNNTYKILNCIIYKIIELDVQLMLIYKKVFKKYHHKYKKIKFKNKLIKIKKYY